MTPVHESPRDDFFTPNTAGEATLARVEVVELSKHSYSAKLYSNPLGKACYQLDQKQVEHCILDLRDSGLLEAGLVFASEVRTSDGRKLSAKETRQFQLHIGCPPLLLACVACSRELNRVRLELRLSGDASLSEREKDVQMRAADLVKVLVRNGARITAQDVGPLRNTALHAAALGGAPQLVAALLRLDADLLLRNSNGDTPEVLAHRAGNTSCEQILQVAAMLDMEKQEALAKELVDEAVRSGEQEERKGRDPRRHRKRRQREARAASQQGAGSGSGESVQDPDSGSDGAADQQAAVAQRQNAGARASERGRVDAGTAAEHCEIAELGSTSFGSRSFWSTLDEEHNTEMEAELSDDWDEAKWGEYQDWGEDWDAGSGSRGASTSESDAAASGDDDEVRAEVARLQNEKASQLQQLYDLAASRQERLQEAERAEKRSKRLQEHLKTWEEREARVKAGDLTATEDSAQEVEVSAWWEKRATAHARSVWEFEKTLMQQRREQKEVTDALEKELRAMKRRTQGMEDYWDHYFEAQSANELVDCLTAESRYVHLVDDLARLVASLEIPPELKEQLPPLLVQDASGDDSLTLPPVPELMVALQVHHKIQEERRKREAAVDEMLGICNAKLEAKDEEILTAVEAELVRSGFPDGGDEEDLEGWSHIADLAANAREGLEQVLRQGQSGRPW